MASSKKNEMIQLRIKYLILLALLAEELHGYEIMKRIKEIALGGVKASPGSIYPILHKLEREGLVRSREEVQGGRRIRVYSLTDKGIKTLMMMVLDVLVSLTAAMRIHMNILTKLRETGRIVELRSVAETELEELKTRLLELEELLRDAIRTISFS